MKENPLQAKVLSLHHRLVKLYGEKKPERSGDPVAALVNTILSQNTNDHNRDLAYQQLRERFSTWEEVRDASEAAVVDAIRPAGLAPSKGPRIQAALRTIPTEGGELSLQFLNDLPLNEAREWLTSLQGVGPKTAAIVLLFSLGKPAFPVDTHIYRLTRRWGLIPAAASREQAHVLLEQLVPPSLYYSFHINIIEHGRTICGARNPQCAICQLQDLCLYYQHSKEGKENG
jgi:endonuclease-3